MRIIFFGTPDYVLPILTAVHKKFVSGPGRSPIIAVVTQSPKPTGRKQLTTYSPVDKWAHDHKIPIFYAADDLKKENLSPDLGILASYGEIIKKDVISLFPKGILVIHPSLLPKYRGSSPAPTAIQEGEIVTGATIIKMDEKMDHGPIISQFKEDISPTETGEELRNRLFARSAEVLAELIEPYLKGKITPRPQDDSRATYTKIFTKEDGYVDLKKETQESLDRKIRALFPWPGVWTTLPDGKRLKFLPNEMVQLEGKNPVTLRQFKEAHPATELAAKD